MNIKEALIFSMDELKGLFPSYKIDALCLIKSVTKLSELEIMTNQERPLSEDEESKLKSFIERRKSHEPIAHITGIKEFYGLDFKVNNQTLIPRPDSEMMVEKALEIIKEKNISNPKILELGVGSGAVIISILKNCEKANGIAVDINPKAIDVAKENAKNHSVSNRLSIFESDWFSNIEKQDFDIIISNPPYISPKDIQSLDKEVKNFEPMLALDGGDKGLNDYIKIINQVSDYLLQNGSLILEIGFNQADDVLSLFDNNLWKYKKCFKDLSNNDRLIISELI